MNIDELVCDLKEHLDTYCQTYDDYDMTYNQTEMIYYLIKNLEKENKKYKEVINKIKDKLFNANSYRNYDDEDDTKYTDLDIDELLDILKEVEHE